MCFVGADASGKTTIIQKFLEKNNSAGEDRQRWVLFKYPNRSTPSGIKIDKILKGELKVEKNVEMKLFADNRAEDKKTILNLLESGINVMLDRYTYCALSYLMTEQYFEVIEGKTNNIISKDYTFNRIIKYDKGLLKPDITFIIYGNFLENRESLEKYDYFGSRREILYNNYVNVLLNTQSKFTLIDNSVCYKDKEEIEKYLSEVVNDIKLKIHKYSLSLLHSGLNPPVERF